MKEESKAYLRNILRVKRAELDAHARMEETQCVVAHAKGLLGTYDEGISVALYHPIQGELDPQGIATTRHLFCLPKVEGEQMVFHRWAEDMPMQRGAYGISEPSLREMVIPDVVLVPLLGVDKAGYRLGYGKGYYDCYFASDKGKDARRIGLAFTCQQVDSLPHEAHDVPLHALITAEGITEFA